jgi:drug/metabolite transporter (DMT)-like permease
MTKLLTVLFIGLLFEAAGVVYLNKGLKQVGEVQKISAGEIARIVKRGAANGNILLGVFFEAIFFVTLLYMMSLGSVNFVWLLSLLGFVLKPISCKFFFDEQISLLSWGGVLLIMLGAGLITYSEKVLEQKGATPPPESNPAVHQ